ncbi:hypothetical protein [Streptomyces sp. NPDC053367]|uniref:hypothetical protein n=1 Tax=Streptomyces sp. NPDC053367 TaxID=3365700 RepID=UPI0037CE5E21
MAWLEGVLWGAFGGFAMEALDYIIAVRRWRRLPWNVGASTLSQGSRAGAHRTEPDEELPAPGVLAYCVAGVLRIAVGGGVALACTATAPGRMSAWLAVLVGATAPVVLEKVTAFVPLVTRVGREGIAATLQQPASGPEPLPPPEAVWPPPTVQEAGAHLPTAQGGAGTAPTAQGGPHAS